MSTNNKASFVQLAREMLSVRSNQFLICQGEKEIVLKTVRITGNKNPAEAMSFMPINFQEWVSEDEWEQAKLYKYFKNKEFLIFIFQQYPSGKRVNDDEMTFYEIKFWKMPDYDLNHNLKDIWCEVRRLLNEDKLEIKQHRRKDGKIINRNNLPSSKFNELGHLRPGGRNAEDVTILPTGQELTKQRFWLNINYIKEIVTI